MYYIINNKKEKKVNRMGNHKFELSDKVSTTAINPRPTNLQDELWLSNKDIWRNVDSEIITQCHKNAPHSNKAQISITDLLFTLEFTTAFALLDRDHQDLLRQLLVHHVSLFAREQHLTIRLTDDGRKIIFIW